MKQCNRRHIKYIIGIDEAGRGPLAGPVAVGAVILFSRQTLLHFRTIRDAKKLSPLQRLFWFKKIRDAQKKRRLDYRVSFRSSLCIDKKGIVYAIRSALERTLEGLHSKPEDSFIFLDGGLKAPKEYTHQKTVIKGDEKIPVIAMASVVAKVTRDKYMCLLSKRFPQYRFDVHKGYGTKMHYNLVKKYGICKIHRLTFLGR